MSAEPEGPIWIAYYYDWSDVVVFTNEFDALRYAVANSMQVKELYSGESVRVDR